MNHCWDIYAKQLMSLGFGHPLWRPEPCLQFGEIRLGDVGYLREGRFRFLFNCMLPAEDPVNAQRGVPSGFEVFSPPDPMLTQDLNEITQTELHSKSLQSLSIAATASAGGTSASASLGLRYQCGEESGALLMLKHPGHKTSLDCTMYIRRYMRTHLASWCDFANGHLGIGLQEQDLIFVSGFVKTSVWATAAFHNSCSSAELLVAGGCFVPSASGEFRVSMSKGTNGSVFSRTGPPARLSAPQSGFAAANDFDQCVFLQYYKAKRRKWRLPAVMRAAAGPHVLEYGPDEDDEQGYPLASAGSSTTSSDEGINSFHPNYDPVDKILDYILETSDAYFACASYGDLYNLFRGQTIPLDLQKYLDTSRPSVLADDDGFYTITLPVKHEPRDDMTIEIGPARAPTPDSVGSKRARVEATAVAASAAKKVKTERDQLIGDAMSKRRQEAEAVQTDDAAVKFFEQMTRWLNQVTENGGESVECLQTEIVDSLDEILKEYPSIPDDSGLPSQASSSSIDAISTMGSSSAWQNASTMDPTDVFHRFTSYGRPEEEIPSRAATPDLLPTSVGSSPANSLVTEPQLPASTAADTAEIVLPKTEPSEGVDSIPQELWHAVDGAESTFYNASDTWKWDQPMPKVDQPWAFFHPIEDD